MNGSIFIYSRRFTDDGQSYNQVVTVFARKRRSADQIVQSVLATMDPNGKHAPEGTAAFSVEEVALRREGIVAAHVSTA
jgi:hypothetical protein